MKKETLIAVVLGVVFGIVVAFFMVFKTKDQATEKMRPITTQLNITPTIIVKNTEVPTLEITEPVTGVIVDKNSVTIKGKTVKNSLLVIQSPIKSITMKNEKDTFSVDFPLAFGENSILVSSYSPDSQGVAQEKELKIYYLDEQ